MVFEGAFQNIVAYSGGPPPRYLAVRYEVEIGAPDYTGRFPCDGTADCGDYFGPGSWSAATSYVKRQDLQVTEWGYSSDFGPYSIGVEEYAPWEVSSVWLRDLAMTAGEEVAREQGDDTGESPVYSSAVITCRRSIEYTVGPVVCCKAASIFDSRLHCENGPEITDDKVVTITRDTLPDIEDREGVVYSPVYIDSVSPDGDFVMIYREVL